MNNNARIELARAAQKQVPRRRRLLMGSLVAAVAVFLAALSALAFRKPTIETAISRDESTAWLTESATAYFDNGDYVNAWICFDKALVSQQDSKWLADLTELSKTFALAGDMLHLDWNSAGEILTRLKTRALPMEDVRSFLEKNQNWLAMEKQCATMLATVLADFEEAEYERGFARLKAAREIFPTSALAKAIGKRIRNAQKQFRAETIFRVGALLNAADPDWNDAMRLLQNYAQLCDAGDEQVNDMLKTCSRNASDRQAIAAALAHYDRGDLCAAKNEVEKVRSDSKYARQAEWLERNLEVCRRINLAEEKFDAGNEQWVLIELAQLHQRAESLDVGKRLRERIAALRTKVEELIRNHSEGVRQMGQGSYLDAMRCFEDVLSLENNPHNHYAASAASLLDECQDHLKQLCSQSYDCGLSALKTGEFSAAASSFEQLQAYDLDRTRTALVKETIASEAQVIFRDIRKRFWSVRQTEQDYVGLRLLKNYLPMQHELQTAIDALLKKGLPKAGKS